FCSSPFGMAQETSSTIPDSVVAEQADTTALMVALQDSLSRQYIFPEYAAYNPMLDNIRRRITVEGNDFIRWMHDMDSLAQAGAERYSKGAASNKPVRPSWVVLVFITLALGIAMVRVFFTAVFRNIILAYYNKQVLQNMS